MRIRYANKPKKNYTVKSGIINKDHEMRILVVGGSGTIGGAVVKALKKLDYEIVTASQK